MQTLPEPYHSLFQAVLRDPEAEAISELVHKGADLSFVHPHTGGTALHTATISDRSRAVVVLLQHGAAPNQRFTYRSPVDGRVEADRVALHYAHSVAAANALIQAGADVNAADAAGITPLMCAAFHGHVAVVRTLLAAGASPLARQRKRRGRKAHTARELAELKIEFFQEAICDANREKAQQRLHCYEEIRDFLREAESGVVAS
jgi:ankyrin repeat protein